ncbi:uncharacterized protein LOC141665245 [Apium graveolens]|uniref:uncharacterized protein LOC141665245 n=1 Tax=Apium graveolens TaxID=4045 RepID=UPI003D794054
MEEGRGTMSSHGSSQANSMRPPRPEAGPSCTSTRHSPHVWNYFSRQAIPEDPNKFKCFYLLCIQSGKNQSPFLHFKGAGTGTLDRHLKLHHGISKQSHESGAARGESPQQTQIGGFVTSSPGGGRRVLDEKRSNLAPDVVKIRVCKKDWNQAVKRQQGRKKDDSDDEEDTWMTMDTSSKLGMSANDPQEEEKFE